MVGWLIVSICHRHTYMCLPDGLPAAGCIPACRPACHPCLTVCLPALPLLLPAVLGEMSAALSSLGIGVDQLHAESGKQGSQQAGWLV